MSNFKDFCKTMGTKYFDDFTKICKDSKITQKFEKYVYLNDDLYITKANELMFYFKLRSFDKQLEFDDKLFTDFKMNFKISGYSVFINAMTFNENELKKTKNMDLLMRMNFMFSSAKIVKPIKIYPAKTSKKYSNFFLKNENRIANNENIKFNLKTSFDDCAKNDNNKINILLICTSTERFVDNVDSLINEYKKNNTGPSFLKFKDYPNVDYIVLSNCSEAHLNRNLNFQNIWDIDNYINFVLPLKINNDKNQIEKNNFIAQVFNDKLMDFYNFKYQKYDRNSYGIFMLQLLNFISDEYSCFDIQK